jgi:hypothetical protein
MLVWYEKPFRYLSTLISMCIWKKAPRRHLSVIYYHERKNRIQAQAAPLMFYTKQLKIGFFLKNNNDSNRQTFPFHGFPSNIIRFLCRMPIEFKLRNPYPFFD